MLVAGLDVLEAGALPEEKEKNQIWLKVLSLSGVLDARKTHTMADRNKIMVAGSCELGICSKWGGGW